MIPVFWNQIYSLFLRLYSCIITTLNYGLYSTIVLVLLFQWFVGTPAMTSRGCVEEDFETIADFLLKAAQITSNIQREHGKFCKDFVKGLQNNKDIVELRNQVETFASQFEMPAYDTWFDHVASIFCMIIYPLVLFVARASIKAASVVSILQKMEVKLSGRGLSLILYKNTPISNFVYTDTPWLFMGKTSVIT